MRPNTIIHMLPIPEFLTKRGFAVLYKIRNVVFPDLVTIETFKLKKIFSYPD
jgi:hypothetical protein